MEASPFLLIALKWVVEAGRRFRWWLPTNSMRIGRRSRLNKPSVMRSTAIRIRTDRTRFAAFSIRCGRSGPRPGPCWSALLPRNGVSRKRTAQRSQVLSYTRQEAAHKLGYGELAAAAAKLPVPKKENLRLKDRSEWRYIGKDNALFDLSDIVTGRATFGMDATMPGMVYASVEHPPVLGQKVKSYDDKAALKVRGVKQTLTIDTFKPPHQFQPLGGVAVIADNSWSAFQGRKALKIDWDSSPHAVYNSDQFRKTLESTSRQPGKVVRNVGDVDAEFAKGGKIIDAEYYAPHLAHASIEP